MTATHRTPGNGGYARGCRCERCTEAHAAYQRGYESRNASSIAAARRRRRRRQRRLPRLRLSFGPVEAAARTGSPAEVARLLEVDRRQVYRWRHCGLTWAQADELAVRIGFHPSAVWGAAWWAQDGDVDDD